MRSLRSPVFNPRLLPTAGQSFSPQNTDVLLSGFSPQKSGCDRENCGGREARGRATDGGRRLHGSHSLILFSLMKSHTDLCGSSSISGVCVLSGVFVGQAADLTAVCQICRHNPIYRKKDIFVRSAALAPVQGCECDIFTWY